MLIRELFDQIKEYKKRIIIVLLLLTIIIALYIILNNKNVKDNKIYDDKELVFTYKKTNGEVVSMLPYINIESNSVSSANNKIINTYYEVIASTDKYMLYEYYQNNKFLSLIVKVYNKYIDGNLPVETDIYNVDLERKMVINDNELKNSFKVTDDEAINTLRELLKEYHSYEINNKYINDCDFYCYLDIVGELNNAQYYVKNNHLYAYLFFNADNNFIYDSSNPFDLFNFKIK